MQIEPCCVIPHESPQPQHSLAMKAKRIRMRTRIESQVEEVANGLDLPAFIQVVNI